MLLMIFVFLIFWSGWVETVHGQHIHINHPITSHGGGYFRAALDGPGHSSPVVKLDSKGNHMIFNEWLINSTCSEVERGNNFSRSVTHKVHVGVEGEIEWGAEAGAKILAVELKAYSKARVQLNGGWTGEWKEELSFSSKTNLQKCQKVWYVFLKNRRKASGYVDTWEHKITCIRPSNLDVDLNYCDKRRLTGSGIGWGTHIGEHVQRGLVDKCPCSDVDPDTKHVFDPSVPVPVPDPNPGNEDEGSTTDKGAPIPVPEEPKYILQNPLDNDKK